MERVRARRYGPRHLRSGPVEVTCHGPYAVLCLGTEATVSGDYDSGIGGPLVELFAAAAIGAGYAVPDPGRLRAGRTFRQVRAGEPERRVVAVETGGGHQHAEVYVHVERAGEVTVHTVEVPQGDAVAVHGELTRWAEAMAGLAGQGTA